MMKSLKYIFHIQFLLLALVGCDNHQSIEKPIEKDDYYEKCRKLVLSENKINQVYAFKVVKKEVDEISITYLGCMKTSKGDTLKFLNSVNFFGQYEDSKRANGAVFIYDNQNQRIGVYYLGGELDVPTKIEGTNLIFTYNDESCNQTTAINFLDSIPNQIFINCTKGGGDLYNFTKE